MHRAWVRQLVVGVHHDVVDNVLGLLHCLGRAGKRHLVFFAGWGVLLGLREVDLDAQRLLDFPHHGALLADKVREVRRVDIDVILGEVIVLERTVPLLDQLLDGGLRLGDGGRRAHDGEEVACGVNPCNAGLLLDHLDLRTFRANDNTDLRLRHTDRGGGSVALSRLLLDYPSGALHGQDALHICSNGLTDAFIALRARWSHARHSIHRSGRHAGDALASRPSLCFLLVLALLALLLLLRHSCVDLPSWARPIIDDVIGKQLGALLGFLLLLNLRRGLALLRGRLRCGFGCSFRSRRGLSGSLGCCLGCRLALGSRLGLRFAFRLCLRLSLGGRGRWFRFSFGLGLALGLGLRLSLRLRCWRSSGGGLGLGLGLAFRLNLRLRGWGLWRRGLGLCCCGIASLLRSPALGALGHALTCLDVGHGYWS
mmetsp:Transcript_53618/g.135431  ORF Transcript_53618/g.135431 Transcript_53618/m.135431 type:complete len:426 (-) Transcript_53618:70-1347(-)